MGNRTKPRTLEEEVLARFPIAADAYPQGELAFILQAVQDVQPSAIFEYGTGSGASGRIFQEAVSVLGLACLIHTTELPDELAPLEAQHPRHNTGQHLTDGVVRKRGDGVTESLVAWAQWRPQRSLWFLDGDHTNFAVYREIALIDRMVPDAVILLHDTNEGPGVGAREWVERQGRHRFTHITGRTGVGRLDRL